MPRKGSGGLARPHGPLPILADAPSHRLRLAPCDAKKSLGGAETNLGDVRVTAVSMGNGGQAPTT